MPHRVFLTRRLPDPVMARLDKQFQLSYNRRDRPLKKNEIIQRMRECEGLIAMLSDPIDARVIASNPRLRIIANYAVGTNNIDLGAANKHGIVVTNTPGVLTDATADLAWTLILSLARRCVEGDRLVRSGKWTGWAPTQLVGRDLREKTLAIVGLGRIGKAVAARARGFGMKIRYFSRTRLSSRDEKRLGVSYLPLNQLVRQADVLSLHCPLTPKTRHLMNRKRLGRMKSSAILINTARGPIVDEKELVRSLRGSRIAGAGLDVFEREPLLEKGLKGLSSTTLLPHLGSASEETRLKMGWMVIENLHAVFKNRKVPNQVSL